MLRLGVGQGRGQKPGSGTNALCDLTEGQLGADLKDWFYPEEPRVTWRKSLFWLGHGGGAKSLLAVTLKGPVLL